MPLIEVLLASATPPTRQQRRAFAAEVQQIFAEELGTRPINLRLAMTHLALEDTLDVLELPDTSDSAASEATD